MKARRYPLCQEVTSLRSPCLGKPPGTEWGVEGSANLSVIHRIDQEGQAILSDRIAYLRPSKPGCLSHGGGLVF